MQKHNVILPTLIAGLWFLLFSCQIVNAEPDQPDAVLRSDSCDSIPGIYKVAGEYLPGSTLEGKTRMDRSLFLRSTYGQRTGVELSWNVSNGLLAVRILGENLLPIENVSYSIKASCMGGKLTYEVEHEGYSEGGTHNKEHLKAWLYKDEAGDLIFNGKISVVSTDLLIFRRTHESEINARFFPLLKSVEHSD